MENINKIKEIYAYVDSLSVDINTLGYTYEKDKTIFRVFAPLSSKLFLILDDKIRYEMIKEENGVFSLVIYDDLEKHFYHYENENNICYSDPFSYADTLDLNNSYILDTTKFNKDKYDVVNKDIVIYELSIRDFTIDLDIEEKGKFLGLIKDDLVKDGYSVGLKYLKELGISHLQIMPIFNYDDAGYEYNWGYNPLSYNILKHQYIYNVDDPYNHINEFREVVNKLHQNGLKVVLDVVFNHVYDANNNILNKMIPNYFFRYKDDGYLANGSWCGNEFKTEGLFARSYIIKMIQRYIELFDIDGLRFDLMGLMDIETINQIAYISKNMKEDFLLYGEGWNMGEVLKEEDRASDYNLYAIKDVGSFNRFYRDGIISYLLGNNEMKEEVKALINGSETHYFTIRQTVNYIECHDGYTFYDQTNHYDESYQFKKIKLSLGIIALSKGFAFYHSGQEFLRTKNNIKDSYNAGDKINKISWERRIQYNDMIEYFKAILKIRKEIDVFNSETYFEDYYEVIKYHFGNYVIFINGSDFDHHYEDGKRYEIVFDELGYNQGIKDVISIPNNTIIIAKIM